MEEGVGEAPSVDGVGCGRMEEWRCAGGREMPAGGREEIRRTVEKRGGGNRARLRVTAGRSAGGWKGGAGEATESDRARRRMATERGDAGQSVEATEGDWVRFGLTTGCGAHA